MAVRYVVEDSSWRGEVNVPRKEFGFNRLRYLWEHCPTGLLYFPNASQDDVNHDLARSMHFASATSLSTLRTAGRPFLFSTDALDDKTT